MNFQRLREPLKQDQSFMVFLDRINSELNAYGVGFALDETRKSTTDYTEEELQIIRDKIRNFII